MGIFGGKWKVDPSQIEQDPLSFQAMQGMIAQPTQQQRSYQDTVTQQQPSPDLQPAGAQQVQPGMFGKGGKGWQIAGVLGDALQTFGGGHGTYMPAIEKQQDEDLKRKQTLADHQMERGDKFTDWKAEQQFKIDHPEAPKPGEQERLIQAWSQLPDNDPKKAMYDRAIRGLQYTPGVMDMRQQQQMDLIDHRGQVQSNLRSQPTYSNLHPQGGGGGNIHGRSHANPIPVGSRAELEAQPKGTWVSLPNGQVTQRR